MATNKQTLTTGKHANYNIYNYYGETGHPPKPAGEGEGHGTHRIQQAKARTGTVAASTVATAEG